MSELSGSRYVHFLNSKQEKLRLSDALDGWFDREEPAEHREAYGQYLRRRRSGAADELLRRGKLYDLRILYIEGILQAKDLDALVERSQKSGRPLDWIRALSLRDELQSRTAGGSAGRITSAPVHYSPLYSARNGKRIASPEQIWRLVRARIYGAFPYLCSAASALTPAARTDCTDRAVEDLPADPAGLRMATDGNTLYYDAKVLLFIWQKRPEWVHRLYLHLLLHCLFYHVTDLHPHEEEVLHAADEQIEELIERECSRQPELYALFGSDRMIGADDHSLFQSGSHTADTRKRWEYIRRQTGSGGIGSIGTGQAGTLAGSDVLPVTQLEKSRRDYRTFLQRFAIWREEMELDPHDFDYVYYTLGMEVLDGHPLIEPLEYREGHRLQQLVIAIDTSGSVKDAQVRRFLEEVYGILDEKENFFSEMEVLIVQCDCVIEETVWIRNQREWKAYLSHLTVTGRAGTDFRPVFELIRQEQEQGRLTKLKGLLYFTDGDGIYPRQSPSYETAFIFTEFTDAAKQVPAWAKVLYAIDEEKDIQF